MKNNKCASEIILDQDALKFNLDFLRSEMGEDVLISSVVKGNAYGHGIETFVNMAAECGIEHFSVFSAEEALRVKNCLRKEIPLMIMGYTNESQLEWAIQNQIEFFVSDFEKLETAIKISKKIGKKCLIHIELETGMNRTGIDEHLLNDKIFGTLNKEQEHYILKGICTHFAGAESISNYIRIQQQKEEFLKLKAQFLERGFNPQFIHTSCSAAAIRIPSMRFNMVRIGIFQYGLWPSQEIKMEYLIKNKLQVFNLKRVLAWKSQIMSVKEVTIGSFIGYGNNYQASEDMKIGIVPVGYANGYSRMLSNSGTVLVNNIRSLVLGNINMNSLVIDLRNAPDAQIGDEVILIGEDAHNEITVASFGELSNQLNYELLTRLPMDIPRIRTNGDQILML